MDVRDDVSSQLERWKLVGIGEPGEAVAVAEHSAHAVAVTQREGQRPDDVVEPGAQTAARDDGRRDVAGSKASRRRGPASSNAGGGRPFSRNGTRLRVSDEQRTAVTVIDELRQAR